MTVAAILKHKGSDVASVTPAMPIHEVTRVLSERRIGAVVVLDASRQLLGIVSERDIVRCLAQHGARALEMTAAQLMTTHVQTATPRTSVVDAMAMMTEGRFRHVPVVEGGSLAGMISIGDVVKSRLDQQEQEVDSLKAYVTGGA